MSGARALIVQHGPSGPAGQLGEWARARGIAAQVHLADRGGAAPDPADYTFLASLGSARTPRLAHEPEVLDHLRLLERALAAGVPVLGICFGGQALAKVLGGEVERAPEPELGWFAIETDEPGSVPPGPWLEWHFDRFTTPPGARELARTPRAVQAFRHGDHLGVQFHPEATIDIVAGWARKDASRIASFGVSDGTALVESGRRYATTARRAAFTLFDAFLAGIEEGIAS